MENRNQAVEEFKNAAANITAQFFFMTRQLEEMITRQTATEAALAEALSREAAHVKRVEELTEENVILKSTIDTYVADFKEEREARTAIAGKLEEMRNELSGCHVYRPVTMFRPNLVHGRDETDLFETYVPDCEPDSARDDVADSGDEKLQCPKCNKSFNMDNHLDLVEHMSECE